MTMRTHHHYHYHTRITITHHTSPIITHVLDLAGLLSLASLVLDLAGLLSLVLLVLDLCLQDKLPHKRRRDALLSAPERHADLPPRPPTHMINIFATWPKFKSKEETFPSLLGWAMHNNMSFVFNMCGSILMPASYTYLF